MLQRSSTNDRALETETVLRGFMLALAAAGVVGATMELATLRHWTTTVQMVPFAVLGVLSVGVALMVARPAPAVIRAVRVIAVLGLLSGLYGLYIHVKANYDSAILDYHFTDRWPTMSLPSKLWAAGTGQVGPSPVLAPAVLSQCAVCLGLATFRHPRLRRVAAVNAPSASAHRTVGSEVGGVSA